MTERPSVLQDLNARNRAIFLRLIETYIETGDPVGSRTLSRQLDSTLSAASIRNVMQDLEIMGLLAAPHASAGRVPTQLGLRLFVDGALEVANVPEAERRAIESALGDGDRELQSMLEGASATLSGLSRCASLVIAPKQDAPVKHVEIVKLSEGQALAVIVFANGAIENRLIETPPGLTHSALVEATNFLNAHLRGHSLTDARKIALKHVADARAELDEAAQALIAAGVAAWSKAPGGRDTLIIRGRANLLDDIGADELERVRALFDDLERQEDVAQILELAGEGEGVRVFIGSENKLYSLSGSSLVISPYRDGDKKIVGAIGVIGPTRLNYARIVPIVDFTARLVGRLVGGGRIAGTDG